MEQIKAVLTLIASHRPVRDDEETARVCRNPEQEKRVVTDDDFHRSIERRRDA